MFMTQFETATCNVCFDNIMIYIGNGKGHSTNTLETSIKEGDEEKEKKNRKGE